MQRSARYDRFASFRFVRPVNDGFSPSATMRPLVLLALALAATHVAAQDWFTISGYPELPGTDVVQISPALSTWQKQVTLEVRASRQAERRGYNGLVYRSYTGMAAVDCDSRKGWFLTLTFYSQPGWEGTPLTVSNFKPEEAPMIFAGIPGAPAERLVNAACAAVR